MDSYPSIYTVTNNYIADCNGETGTDTDGSQSKDVVYDSPRTSSVSDAGAGW